ncbi:CHAT domain-containing protein [Pseudoduganella eburnea]|uniref:CHAT domain-containing protein n=1 Tax=Massilia eburnea TaxID=1776165 RepID=A0A6L6QLY3_9BURK|nr:CHAT domain-containing protein [Massilia eburnea]MTW13418.1 CHAT domain-containing protein [Massilia eburnea]
MKSILIVYSSPADLERLRIDREHRRIEEVINLGKEQVVSVDRKHAATLQDLARTIADRQYDVIHFSGHGGSSGLYFDTNADSSNLVSADHLAKLINSTQKTLCAVVLMSCFSSDMALSLLSAAPYVISITGDADDEATIDFVGHFYEHYLRTQSIESAFRFANAYVDDKLNAVLGHRSSSNVAEDSGSRIVVYPGFHGDPIYVDLSQAKETISLLDISRDRFVSILTRKLRVHQWIFEGERENVIIPVAGYFARFSWKNAKDVVQCHWVYKPKAGLDVAIYSVISNLIVRYNDLYLSSYRRNPRPVALQHPKDIKIGLDHLHGFMSIFLMDDKVFSVLEGVDPDGMRMLRAVCHSNLTMADEKMAQNELSAAAIYAETALSSIHDALERLVELISA